MDDESKSESAGKSLLSKMEVIDEFFSGHSYNTVNPIFYTKDFPQTFIPGKKRPLYQKAKVQKWIDDHTKYGF
ncbi:hypothetical protein YK48G_04340 [Lentilactobacillus fungorum]|uniref:DNA-binding protein n=1 Tax=Lentilactobacillus fungorum TaxID=2201250 RepID=A0ABQ3VYN6_9LACO|nr:hypothetical protein [Lentilactobacillus fungorum]GHP13009.1 hypothetical protein YK48G_04340 [Lentilactobacillus fungorum]